MTFAWNCVRCATGSLTSSARVSSETTLAAELASADGAKLAIDRTAISGPSKLPGFYHVGRTG